MVFDEKKNNDSYDPEIIPSEVFDGKCPYCGSTDVEEGIGKYGFKTTSIEDSKLPEANLVAWHCLNCKKVFFLKI